MTISENVKRWNYTKQNRPLAGASLSRLDATNIAGGNHRMQRWRSPSMIQATRLTSNPNQLTGPGLLMAAANMSTSSRMMVAGRFAPTAARRIPIIPICKGRPFRPKFRSDTATGARRVGSSEPLNPNPNASLGYAVQDSSTAPVRAVGPLAAYPVRADDSLTGAATLRYSSCTPMVSPRLRLPVAWVAIGQPWGGYCPARLDHADVRHQRI